MESAFSLEQLSVSDTVLLIAHGELDVEAAPELADALRSHRPRATKIVVDLRDVSFIDSTGLASLALNATDEEGLAPVQVIAPVQSQPVRLLDLIGLDRLITAPDEIGAPPHPEFD